MSLLRSTSLVSAVSLGGFVFLFSMFGGCSLFGGDDASGGSSSGTQNTGGGGEGGTISSGSMSTSVSSSSGAPIECTDHTTLDETDCSLVKQDCANPGEMCIPNGESTQCVYQTGIKGPGAPCSNNKECEAGSTCVFYTCSPFCCPSQAQAFCGSAQCNVSISFGTKIAFACNLSKTCTLFENACPPNQGCRLGDPTQELALCAPQSANPAAEGESCEFLNDCGDNQLCSPKGNVCRYTCLLDGWQTKEPGLGGCPINQTCLAASTNYGVCDPGP